MIRDLVLENTDYILFIAQCLPGHTGFTFVDKNYTKDNKIRIVYDIEGRYFELYEPLFDLDSYPQFNSMKKVFETLNHYFGIDPNSIKMVMDLYNAAPREWYRKYKADMLTGGITEDMGRERMKVLQKRKSAKTANLGSVDDGIDLDGGLLRIDVENPRFPNLLETGNRNLNLMAQEFDDRVCRNKEVLTPLVNRLIAVRKKKSQHSKLRNMSRGKAYPGELKFDKLLYEEAYLENEILKYLPELGTDPWLFNSIEDILNACSLPDMMQKQSRRRRRY